MKKTLTTLLVISMVTMVLLPGITLGQKKADTQNRIVYAGWSSDMVDVMIELETAGKSVVGKYMLGSSSSQYYRIIGERTKKGKFEGQIYAGDTPKGTITGKISGDTLFSGNIEPVAGASEPVIFTVRKIRRNFPTMEEIKLQEMQLALQRLSDSLSQVSGVPRVDETMDSNAPVTTVVWAPKEYDFGTIKVGEQVTFKYTVKNTGNEDYTIYSVKPSCGCTTPSYSQEPIPPGGEGFIEVAFDSKGKNGAQRKSITVTGNTVPKTEVLTFHGEITAE